MIRLLIAGGLALVVSLFGTKLLINWLVRHRIGQPIRDDGPDGHHTKAGTPTMGGLAIVGGVFVGYTVSDLYNGIFTRTGILVVLAIVAAGLVGLADDWIKVTHERNLGLNKRTKAIGLLTVAIGFSVMTVAFTDVHTELSFTRWDNPGIQLGAVGWVIWAVLLILAASNAVNLTDGLDGLAGGSAIFSSAAYIVIAFWAFRNPDVYDVEHALDLAVVAAAVLGATTGFLWWNAAPAKIFMGDTGSLALGTGVACLALTTNTHLLLPIVGGLFVAETVSVILQVATFRLFQGRRLFRMAPIHHHFELQGWPETTVIIRFWIIAGLMTALALGFFYGDFVSIGAAD
ncbi:MAG: phospho-N-acetylmuramoyl-pentapeptide-transferase [Acidimicrobiia bacterium]|nr:phospho-N-acetylmuramoyl-pentapeptide-transferase [Acidimicrobiia bacterium]